MGGVMGDAGEGLIDADGRIQERMEELERERERLRDLRAQAVSERARLAKLDVELDTLRKQHA